MIHGGFSMKIMICSCRPEHVVKRMTTVVLCLLVLVVIVSLVTGCGKRSQEPPGPVGSDNGNGPKQTTPGESPSESEGQTHVKPHLVKSYEVPGQVWSVNPNRAISPDGKNLLAVRYDTDGTEIVVLPISDAGTANPGGLVLHSVDNESIQERMFGYYPLGWISTTECIFIVQGWQNQGAHKGKCGVALFVGDVEEGSSEETTFIDLPEEGYLGSGTLVPEAGKAYVYADEGIWAYDIRERVLTLLKGGLLTYDGLFNPKISPDGRHFVYEIYEDDKRGIFLLDTATGSEKPLLPLGETMSFYPSWSPDGQYIAAYTASRRANDSGGDNSENDWDDYEILAAEDGLLPVAGAISIVDLNGKIVSSIKVKGKMVSDFKWSPGGDVVAFLCGSVRKSGEGLEGFNEFVPESIYLAGLGKEPSLTELTDISRDTLEEGTYLVLAGVDPDGRGVLYNYYGSETVSVWHVRTGSPDDPIKVEDGVSYYDPIPVYGDSLLSIVEGFEKSGVWLFTPDGAEQIVGFEGSGTTSLLGFDEDTVVIGNEPAQFHFPADEKTTCTVMVFEVGAEKQR